MKKSTEIITLHGQSTCINSFGLYTHYSYNGNKVVKMHHLFSWTMCYHKHQKNIETPFTESLVQYYGINSTSF